MVPMAPSRIRMRWARRVVSSGLRSGCMGSSFGPRKKENGAANRFDGLRAPLFGCRAWPAQVQVATLLGKWRILWIFGGAAKIEGGGLRWHADSGREAKATPALFDFERLSVWGSVGKWPPASNCGRPISDGRACNGYSFDDRDWFNRGPGGAAAEAGRRQHGLDQDHPGGHRRLGAGDLRRTDPRAVSGRPGGRLHRLGGGGRDLAVPGRHGDEEVLRWGFRLKLRQNFPGGLVTS